MDKKYKQSSRKRTLKYRKKDDKIVQVEKQYKSVNRDKIQNCK